MAQLDKIRLSGTTYDIIDATAIHSLDGYYTTGETNAAITAATNALAESIAEQGYQTSGDVQNAISGKADADDVYTKQETSDLIDEKIAEASGTTTGEVQTMIDQAVSGKVDTTTYTAYTAATDSTLSDKADKSEIPSVSGYADSVKYNSTSKYVEFYHGGTGGTKVFEYDASPFLIDGMVQNVEIKDVEISGETITCLVVSFNTDAGKQDINIPLTDIFDASNYYTKTEVDAALSAKSDSSAVTEEISAAVSGKVDTNTYTAYTAATDTALANKADLSAATITSSESGTVTSSIGGSYSIDLQYDYSDSVYYFSGHMQSIQYLIESFTIKYSDGTNEVSVNQNQTGETSDYTFTMTESDFVFQTKGSKKITRVNFTFDSSSKTLNYTYKYSNDTEIAVSTYIEDEINPALSGKVDSSTYTAYTAATDTALAGKQATLVSGTNIKTINGSSILGSGDLVVDTGLHAEVSGTTLIFQ